MLFVYLLQFQFHKGTIKTQAYQHKGKHRHYFNSIKVQLKPTRPSSGTCSLIIFQFHKGTIKTIVRIAHSVSFDDFNSIKVQLKPCSRLKKAML